MDRLLVVGRTGFGVIGARLRGVLALLLIGSLAACSAGTDSPEAQVRAYLTAGEQAAQNRDLRTLRGMISARYRDAEMRDRRALIRLLAGYFLRKRSIHLLSHVKSIGFADGNSAQVTLFVAMAARPIADSRALLSLHGDLFRFELRLVREQSDWKLIRAAWRPAAVSDFGNG